MRAQAHSSQKDYLAEPSRVVRQHARSSSLWPAGTTAMTWTTMFLLVLNVELNKQSRMVNE